jgi:hypothetical protein
MKYVVAQNKSISTPTGIKSSGQEISRNGIGNFDKMIQLGWIIPVSEIVEDVKSEEIETEQVTEQVTEIIPEEKELTKNEIMEKLKEKNIDFDFRQKKADLLKLLNEDREDFKFGAKRT